MGLFRAYIVLGLPNVGVPFGSPSPRNKDDIKLGYVLLGCLICGNPIIQNLR